MLLRSAAGSTLLLCLLSLLCCLICLPSSHALNVYIPAKDSQCFFEYIPLHDKVVGSYWVSEGGNLDIDLKITGPDSKVVYEKERTTEGSFQFKTTKEGVHTLCFDNRMSTISGKTISFNLYVGDALHRKDAASQQSLTPLESAVVKTAEGLHAMRDSVHYIKGREERHAQTVDSTNARVIFWSAINCSALIVVAAAQIWAIRGLFEKTRKA